MKLKELLNESKIIIYHGGTTELNMNDTKWMYHKNSNNQEGVGYYFGDLKTAETYGDILYTAEINQNDFVDSLGYVDVVLKDMSKVEQLYIDLHTLDNEPLYYELTDWGIEVSEPEDVTEEDLRFLANKQDSQEVRNLQIDLAEKFGVQDFVTIWNNIFPHIKGTYNKQLNFWCIIDTSLEVERIA